MGLRRYLFRIALATDIWCNAALGGELEPMSDSLARHEREGNKAACWLCKALSFVFREANHCQQSAKRTLERYRAVLGLPSPPPSHHP